LTIPKAFGIVKSLATFKNCLNFPNFKPDKTMIATIQIQRDVHYIKQIPKIFFFLGGGLTLLALLMGGIKAPDFFKTLIVNGFASSIFWVGNDYLADLLDTKFPWTGNTIVRVLVSILTTVVYTFIGFIAVIWVWGVVNNSPHSVAENFSIRAFWGSLMITTFISVIVHGSSFLREWKASLVEAEKLKKDHITAQYETLKNQVNPHFLFNSFNVLTTLVHKDADLAEQFVRQLSNVYRYVLDSRDKEVVPLEMELKQLEAYIFLMKIRFGESLKADIKPMPVLTRNEAIKGVSVAPLTLQMLFENALKHNAVSKSTPLSIEVFQEGNEYIVVKNLIQLKNSVGESTGVGLENIRSRYKFLSDKAVIVLQEGGFFMVKIPIIK
jgi:sensor histidine kinase YesM